MHKLITFDGRSGSGKFTNSVKLCEHLGIERVNDSLFTIGRHILESGVFLEDPLLRPIIWASVVKLSHALDWKKREVFTLGGFWQYIIEFFAWNDISDDDKDVLMDAFDTIILKNTEDIYPICSFYLDLSIHESKNRVTKRGEGFESIRIEDWVESPQHREENRVFKEVANWLSNRYPFFYIIDASQSENKVFENVLNIVEGSI